MGTFLEIHGGPEEVSAVGARLRALGETLRTQAQQVLGEIQAVHAERPWGCDKYGTAFEGSYRLVPDGCDEPLPDLVDEGMSTAGARLTEVGDVTVRAMTGYQGADEASASEIDKIKP